MALRTSAIPSFYGHAGSQSRGAAREASEIALPLYYDASAQFPVGKLDASARERPPCRRPGSRREDNHSPDRRLPNTSIESNIEMRRLARLDGDGGGQVRPVERSSRPGHGHEISSWC